VNGALILLAIGIILLLFAWYLWRKGDPNQPFWIALLETLSDIFLELVFTSYRTWALFLWLIGFVMVLLGIFALYKNATLLIS
jgi:hypothetical protein